MSAIFYLASALLITIITATHQAHVRNASTGEIVREQYWWEQYHKHSEAPLNYKHGGRAIAAVVFAWLGFASIVPR
jgi:hypothetical protein